MVLILLSLSARRAWIEIAMTSQISVSTVVALRKESVDRNRGGDTHANRYYVSLSARRAWIEIFIRREISLIRPSLSARRAWIEMVAACPFSCCGAVALRKESVDRNLEAVSMVRWTLRRSPQGERG